MATGTLAPLGIQFFNNAGAMLAGGKIRTRAAGTTTNQATYQNSTLTTPHANPIILDAAGRPPAPIFLDALAYKFEVFDASDNLLATYDNIISSGVIQAGLGEVWTHEGDPDSPTAAASYPLGATVDALHAGTIIVNFDSANLVVGATYRLEGMLKSDGGGTVTAMIANLTDAPNTALVEIATTNLVGTRVQSSAITFPAGGAAKDYGIKIKVSSGNGFGWGFRLVRTA